MFLVVFFHLKNGCKVPPVRLHEWWSFQSSSQSCGMSHACFCPGPQKISEARFFLSVLLLHWKGQDYWSFPRFVSILGLTREVGFVIAADDAFRSPFSDKSQTNSSRLYESVKISCYCCHSQTIWPLLQIWLVLSVRHICAALMWFMSARVCSLGVTSPRVQSV